MGGIVVSVAAVATVFYFGYKYFENRNVGQPQAGKGSDPNASQV
jgi:predicted negative regulator of RcsB-dependent stress response